MAGPREMSDEKKMQELVKKHIRDHAPRMVAKAMKYCEKYFDCGDQDKEKLAHKIYDKLFSKMIPDQKILTIEERPALPPLFQQAMTQIASEALYEIENEDDTVDDTVALKIRNSTRK